MPNLYAGFARQAITPPLGSDTAGYFEPHQAKEIVNDLFADTLVLQEEGGAPVALVDCDVIALSAETVQKIRARIQQLTGIPNRNILISATHTHTGPYTLDIFKGMADQIYLAFLEDQVCLTVQTAFQQLQPVSLHFTRTRVEGISCNRRMVFGDGSVHTHTTEADLPEMMGSEGPVDQELAVLEFRHLTGAPMGLVVNFALHPTNVRGERICSDYPGYLSDQISLHLGDEVLTLFTNGACGNIDSKTPELQTVAYGPQRAMQIAEVLGQTVVHALAQALSIDHTPVRVASEQVAIPLKEVPAEFVERASGILRGNEPESLFFTQGTRRPSLHKEKVYAREALLLAEMRKVSPMVSVEVQVIRLGEIVIVGVPVELFCEYGLEIKACAQQWFKGIILIELANGCFGYVPTLKAFEGGGYETRLARSSQLAPGAGELLCQTAIKILKQVADMR
jgi:hypothetical protein